MRTGDAPTRRRAAPRRAGPRGGQEAYSPTWGHKTRGFTYLWLLFALALGGVALAALGELEQTRQRREREAELRFRGEAIAAALGRYAERTPVGHLPLPQQLEELLADTRFPKPQRHLRQLYADPFTGRPNWELVLGQATIAAGVDSQGKGTPKPQAGRGIVGVRSSSTRHLLATADGRSTAHDWVFVAPPPADKPIHSE
ncbi:type II secretion system protein [Roseateles saccharophilus]|uniref:Type II secretory pathway pseudopilin PulG n=1 Tax=Roseateles saccharophilus TaxID=304 RepID=A0A4R3UVT3_ROSSA|nr:type II secretion system protein [Roseateles saccharophilus]MDG0833076.1 type II secretion system protein [Roseateles saccharophilus]TCU96275.1 type II secretory pathway pseudopilin PulG [Roseateles saccharophilus]